MTDAERTISRPAKGELREARLRILDDHRIAIGCGASTELIAWSEVVSARSLNNYTLIITSGRTLKVRSPLCAVVENLAVLGLVQVRRDTAVNVARVKSLRGGGRHRLALMLDNDCRVEVGRQFQRNIRARFATAAVR
jgi:DNA-binding LytR/AlgR family response regulator